MAAPLLSRLWSSPTAMMLASTGLSSLVQIVVLPLVLYRFDAATVALWALFSTIAAFSNLASSAITVTYVRAVAFALAGARDLDDIAAGRRASERHPPNLELLAQLVAGARASFGVIALGTLVVLATAGTALVERLVTATADPAAGWLAWAIVIGATATVSQGNVYVGYLEGHNHVALVRRWDAIFALIAAGSSTAVLVGGGDLTLLVASTQLWVVLRVVRNRALCRRVEEGRFVALPRRPARPAMRTLWPAVWRSFLGVAMVVGVNQAGGIFYAQIGEPRMVATYLLAVRILEVISQVARAPFYARIPALVRLHAQGDTELQVTSARTGMRLTYWLFVLGVLSAAALGPVMFAAIGSDVPFPPRLLWIALGLALLIERYGAMHLQLFSTTNQIVWHTAAAGYAVLYLVTLAVLHRPLGVYAFPLAMVVGYTGWFSWYSARRAYRAFHLQFWTFERAVFLPPLVIVLVAFVTAWVTT